MYRKLAAAVAIGALISTAALAQNSNPSNSSNSSATNKTETAPASAKGEWQASKLIHLNVYNAKNEKIGDIKELMLDKSGKINSVAIGVGGFLGMGEHDVAVKFEQLKWINEPVKSGSANSASNSSTTGSGQSKKNATYPDHAMLDVTKDQLKGMPQFDYNK